MAGFERGTIVSVPFPYTNRDIQQRRPALVISNGAIGRQGFLLWVVMVTSAEHRSWPGDVRITNHATAGLPAPSVVRTAKIANIEATAAQALGKVSAKVLTAVEGEVRQILGL